MELPNLLDSEKSSRTQPWKTEAGAGSSTCTGASCYQQKTCRNYDSKCESGFPNAHQGDS